MFSNLTWGHTDVANKEQGHNEEPSLNTVLQSPKQKGDLTLLVAELTNLMRHRVECTFQPLLDQSSRNITCDASGAPRTRQSSRNESAEYTNTATSRSDHGDEEAILRPDCQELQIAAMGHFDRWREAVLQRIGEVVNSSHIAKSQSQSARPMMLEQQKGNNSLEQAENDDSRALNDLYPPVTTPMADLEQGQRVLILYSLLLLLLSLEHYSAYSRVLLLRLTSSLQLSHKILAENEKKVARALLKAATEMSADKETKQKAEENASSRKWKLGLASVAGAAVIGITGGLAAPLVAAGLGSVMGGLGLGATAAAGYLGTLASSSVVVGGLFGAYGARMSSHMMDQYAKAVNDFAFLPIRTGRQKHSQKDDSDESRRLRVAIGISGWLTTPEEVTAPWKALGDAAEPFALRWEVESLLNLGNAISTMVKNAAWGKIKGELIKRTVLASLTAALWPLGLLKISRIVDNPFSVAKARSDLAGEVLAEALINRAQGERPVTLVGFSLGARLIYTCLMTLARKQAFGLIEDVVLIGTPAPSDVEDWQRIRAVVAGRLVNVYSTNDYILGFLYRGSSIQLGVAGLQEITGVDNTENLDATDIVGSHAMYRYAIGSILRTLGFQEMDVNEVERDEAILMAKEQEENTATQVDEVRDEHVDDMQRQIASTTQQTLQSWQADKKTNMQN